MTEPFDRPFDRSEVEVAVRLDHEIDSVIGGQPMPGADPVVTWLAAALRADPPSSLAARIAAASARAEGRRLRPIRVAAAVLAYLFLSHGIGNIVSGEWVATNLSEAHSPHAYTEGGLALIAVGLVAAAAVFWRSWMPAAVASGVPLGLAFGILGVNEVGEFGAGAALHLSQAGVAGFLGLAWLRLRRRYGQPVRNE